MAFLLAILLSFCLCCSCTGDSAGEIGSIINFRDLGQYEMKDGKTVRSARLLRGAALADITPEDSIVLADTYRLAKVYDFRADFEIERLKDKQIGNSVNRNFCALDISYFPQNGKRYDSVEELVSCCATQKWFQEAVGKMYYGLAFGDYCRNSYSLFLKDLVETEEGAVYMHCSFGKDRTGFAAALVLYALGADKELIIDDFAKSNAIYDDDIARVREVVRSAGGDDKALETADAMIGVSVKNFRNVLDSIDRRFGSGEKYLEQWLGIGQDDIRILRDRYLE